MRAVSLFAAALLATTMLAAGPAMAKSLVYCSEGSPENFTPQINTTGTSLDAARGVYQSTGASSSAARPTWFPASPRNTTSPTTARRSPSICGRASSSTPTSDFKPTRDFNADDVLFSFNRQWKDDHPYHKVSGGAYDYFNDMDMPELLKSIDKIDDYTVKFTLKEPNAPILANLAMDFATILSAEYADYLMKAGTPEKFDQEPVGTGPFQFVNYQKDAVIRYKAFPDYWGGKAKIDDLVFAITPDADGALGQAQGERMPGDDRDPNPADLAAMKANDKRQPSLAAGPQRRLSRRSTSEAALRQEGSSPGDDHGDRQGGDPQGRLSGRRPVGQEPRSRRPSGPTTTRSRITSMTPTRPRRC